MHIHGIELYPVKTLFIMFNFKIFVPGIEHSEYGGMSIPPPMQDQGTCNDFVIRH